MSTESKTLGFKDFAGKSLDSIRDRLNDIKLSLYGYLDDKAVLISKVLKNVEKRREIIAAYSYGVSALIGLEAASAFLVQFPGPFEWYQPAGAVAVGSAVYTAVQYAVSKVLNRRTDLFYDHLGEDVDRSCTQLGEYLVQRSPFLPKLDENSKDLATIKDVRSHLAETLGVMKILNVAYPLKGKSYHNSGVARENILPEVESSLSNMDAAYQAAERITDTATRDAYLIGIRSYADDLKSTLCERNIPILTEIGMKFGVKEALYSQKNTSHAFAELTDISSNADYMGLTMPMTVHTIEHNINVQRNGQLRSPADQYNDVVHQMSEMAQSLPRLKCMGLDMDKHPNLANRFKRAIVNLSNACCDTMFHGAANVMRTSAGMQPLMRSNEVAGLLTADSEHSVTQVAHKKPGM